MKVKSPIIPSTYTIVMNYKPYSPEWHRYRYLKEALDKYLDDYVDNSVIYGDILSVLSERSESAYQEFAKINALESMIDSSK